MSELDPPVPGVSVGEARRLNIFRWNCTLTAPPPRLGTSPQTRPHYLHTSQQDNNESIAGRETGAGAGAAPLGDTQPI